MALTYETVNNQWPKEVPIPTPEEALRGARRLVRLALTLGPPNRPKISVTRYRFKLTSGRRYSWPRRGVFYINPDKQEFGVGRGWQALCHDLSHWAHQRLYGKSGHTAGHAYIEKRLGEFVIANGWLDGALKKPAKLKEPVDRQEARHQRTIELIASWERKQKLAATKLKKLRIRKRYYEKMLKQKRAIKASRMGKARKLDLDAANALAAPQISARSLDLD
jgi:hypothetical protein